VLDCIYPEYALAPPQAMIPDVPLVQQAAREPMATYAAQPAVATEEALDTPVVLIFPPVE
jgi:hypothetical protein